MLNLRSLDLRAFAVRMMLLVLAALTTVKAGDEQSRDRLIRSENEKELSNYLALQTAPDESSPVSLSETDEGEVVLHWTAPGDDGYVGRASGYDIRYRPYSAGPIENEQHWNYSTAVSGEPMPSPAGQTDSMVVSGLQGGESYYFCIKSFDDVGNYSGLSNCVLKSASDFGFTLNISINGQGNVTVDPERDYYEDGEMVTLYAQADIYWEFVGWTGDIESDNNPFAFPMTDDLNITANFTTDFIPGDANGDGQVITSDVTYLVSYFRGEVPQPSPYLAGDANGSCEVNGHDVTYLVGYFRGIGDPPVRGDCEYLFLSNSAESDEGKNR